MGLRGGADSDDYALYSQRMPYWTKLFDESGPVKVRLVPGDHEPHLVARKEGYPDIQIRTGSKNLHKLERLGWEIVDLEVKHYEEGSTIG